MLGNKTVLITGANHGIGAAMARAFAAERAKVFIAYFRPPCRYSEEELREAEKRGTGGDALYRAMQQKTPEKLIASIREQGVQAEALEADLAVPENIPLLFDRCEESLGSVDALVCNHTHCVLETFDPALTSGEGDGIYLPTAARIDAHFAVNARATALLMAEYLARYLRRGASSGRIINISTDAAHAHVANISYAASKHAIESYSRSAAAEMGKYGITVNIIAPGPIQTGYIPPDLEAEIAQNTPLGRVGKPEDVADVVVFLASERARWLTGQLLYVGGGWRMGQ
ncbi:MAG: SDR family oxidoreductase [Armatimonadetes bacterium]|nr:SDR family oxidoreductase [Armatimonadota bacterium]